MLEIERRSPGTSLDTEDVTITAANNTKNFMALERLGCLIKGGLTEIRQPEQLYFSVQFKLVNKHAIRHTFRGAVVQLSTSY